MGYDGGMTEHGYAARRDSHLRRLRRIEWSAVAALSLISLRGRGHHETTQLSGMAQAVGYTLAAAGPVVAGYLTQVTGGWSTTLVVFAVLAATQFTLGFVVGRDDR